MADKTTAETPAEETKPKAQKGSPYFVPNIGGAAAVVEAESTADAEKKAKELKKEKSNG